MFGFHCLNDLCTIKWKIISDKMKNDIQILLLNIYQNGINNNKQRLCDKLIRQQISKCIVEVAGRTWPDKWKNMDNIIFMNATKNVC